MNAKSGAYVSVKRDGSRILLHVDEEEGELTVKEAKEVIEMLKKAIQSDKDRLFS